MRYRHALWGENSQTDGKSEFAGWMCTAAVIPLVWECTETASLSPLSSTSARFGHTRGLYGQNPTTGGAGTAKSGQRGQLAGATAIIVVLYDRIRLGGGSRTRRKQTDANLDARWHKFNLGGVQCWGGALVEVLCHRMCLLVAPMTCFASVKTASRSMAVKQNRSKSCSGIYKVLK